MQLTNFSLTNTASYQLKNGRFSAKISCKFQALVDVTTASFLHKDIRLSGELSLEISGLPVRALDHYKPFWTGFIESAPHQKIQYVDSSLFDGRRPAFTVATKLPISKPSAVLNYTVMTAADVNVRLGPMDALISHHGNTIRGLFLPSSVLLPFLRTRAVGRESLISQSSYACQGTQCPSSIISASQDLISDAANCSSSYLVNFAASLSLDMTMDNDSIDIQSVSATSQAIFGCTGNLEGFISLSLSVSTPQATIWPLVDYLSDPKAAAGLVKSSPLDRTGSMTGYLTDVQGNIQTIVSLDLFSASRAGLSIPDLPVTSQSAPQLQQLFNLIGMTAVTGIAAVDAAIVSSFSDVTAVFGNYVSGTMNATERGFIQYYAGIHSNSMNLHFSEDGRTTTLTFSLPISTPITLSDPIIATANQLLNSFGNSTISKVNGNEYPIPQITSNTPLIASISAFVVAAVDISGMGNSTEFSLSSIQVSATAQISASFNPGYLFSSFNTFIDLKNGYNSIEGILTQALGGNEVKQDDSGIIYVSGTFPVTPSVIAVQFLNLTNYLGNFTSQSTPLLPTTIDVSLIGETTQWKDLGVDLSASIANLPAGSQTSLIESTLDSTLQSLMSNNSYIHSKIIASTTGVIQLHIQYRNMQSFTITTDNTVWKPKLDTSRLDLAIITSTEFVFSVSEDGISFQVFQVSGSCQSNAFNIPLVKGMIASSITMGTIIVTVDEENSFGNSAIQLNAIASSRNSNTTLTVDLVDPNLLQYSQYINFQVSPDCNRMAPELITSTIVDGFFNMFMMSFQYSLNLVVPPLQSNLSNLSDLPSGLAKMTPWFYVPVMSNPPVASTAVFCAPTDSQVTLSLQWNSMPNVQCTISLDTTTLQNAVDQLNQGIQACGLQNVIAAKLGQIAASESECGTIEFFQANPGLIWMFNMNVTGGVGNTSNFWISQTMPTFNNWEDMAVFFAVLLQLDEINMKPVYSSVSLAEAPYLVPPELVPYYPAEFDTVAMEMNIQVTNQANAPTVNQISNSNSSVTYSLNGGTLSGSIVSWLDTQVIVALGTPPYGGGNNLSLFTNFSSPDGTQGFVVSGNNTFILYIEAELRTNSSQVTTINGSFPIVLTVGSTIYDAFTSEIVSAITDPTLSPLIQVVFIPAKNYSSLSNYSRLTSNEQMRITASRVISNYTLILPRIISIQNSTLNYLNNRTIVFPTYQVLAGNTSIGIDANMNLNIPSINGIIGIVDVSSNSTNGTMEMSIMASSPGYQNFAKLFLSAQNPRRFFELWNTTVAINNQVIADHLEMGIQDEISGPLTSTLFIANQWNISSLEEFNYTKNNLNFTSQFPNGEKVLSGLQQTSSDTFCIWFDMINTQISDLILSQTYVSANLPLVKKSLKSLWQDSIGKTLANIQQKLCNNSKVQSTVNDLCALMNGMFGANACSYSNISDVMLSVQMDFQLQNAFPTKFLLNTPAIYSNSSVPVGVGATSDLTISTVLDATIALVVEFTDGQISVYLAPGTGFTLQFQMGANGKINVAFGPLLLTLGNLDASLGNPSTLWIGVNNNLQTDFTINGAASLYADVESLGEIVCQLEITCSSIYDYIQGDYTTTHHSEVGCGGTDFAGLLGELIIHNRIYRFFSQDFLVATQLVSAYEDTIGNNLWGEAGVLLALDIPLIRQDIQTFLQKELGAFISPPLLNQFCSLLSQSVLDMVLHGSYNDSVLDQLILEAFTDIFCYVFKPYLLACPQVPVWTSQGISELSRNLPSRLQYDH